MLAGVGIKIHAVVSGPSKSQISITCDYLSLLPLSCHLGHPHWFEFQFPLLHV